MQVEARLMAVDPFEVLGLEPAFGVDLAVLEQRHRDLSRTLHPDRHATAGAAERRMALGRAIEVNEAFRNLKDPVRRAEALLARRGVTSGEGKEPAASPALLMEVMERREALSEIRLSKDQAALLRLIADAKQEEQSVVASLARQFENSAADPVEIVKKVGELRYYRRFLEEAHAIADDLL